MITQKVSDLLRATFDLSRGIGGNNLSMLQRCQMQEQKVEHMLQYTVGVS